jgi:hypothetical protein
MFEQVIKETAHGMKILTVSGLGLAINECESLTRALRVGVHANDKPNVLGRGVGGFEEAPIVKAHVGHSCPLGNGPIS